MFLWRNRGDSNEYPQHVFMEKSGDSNEYPQHIFFYGEISKIIP